VPLPLDRLRLAGATEDELAALSTMYDRMPEWSQDATDRHYAAMDLQSIAGELAEARATRVSALPDDDEDGETLSETQATGALSPVESRGGEVADGSSSLTGQQVAGETRTAP
jgi:hypothetical protein